MKHSTNLLITMLAPMLWGTTYLVTSGYLPQDYPITVAMLRALPAGVLMLLLTRQLPQGKQWIEAFVLGGLNFTIFWICLFIAAYQLPGGIAATVGAIQPIIVIFVAFWLLNQQIHKKHLFFACFGIIGITLVVLKSSINLNILGIISAIIGATSMAIGSVLSKKWRGNASLLTFTSWQLTAGGILLVPLALYIETPLPKFNITSIAALIWLGFFGGFLSYILWFRGIATLAPIQVSILSLLSPVTAIFLDYLVQSEKLTILQIIGILIIILSIIGINYQGNKDEHINSHSIKKIH